MKRVVDRVTVVMSCIVLALLAGSREQVLGQAAVAAASAASSSSQLGSPAFRPSPERPVGWRGDWTGRFPGATPPTQWSRRVQGITSEIKYQAEQAHRRPRRRQPSAGVLHDQGVAGGRAVRRGRPRQGHRQGFPGRRREGLAGPGRQGGQRDVEAPARRHRHAELPLSQRRHLRRSERRFRVRLRQPAGGRDASRRLDVPLNNKVAYAHTYVHSPAAAEVMLRVNYAAAAIKVFLNGRVVADPARPAGQGLAGEGLEPSAGEGRQRRGRRAGGPEPLGQPLAVRRLPGTRAAGFLRDAEHRLDDQDDRAEHVAADRRRRPDLRRLGHDATCCASTRRPARSCGCRATRPTTP